jgi:hypothetical protein
MHGLDHLWFRWIRLNLAPEPPDANAYTAIKGSAWNYAQIEQLVARRVG